MEAPRSTQPETQENAAVGTPPLQQAKKPKRKYTVSEKARAASRRNLVLANQAPHWLKYRLSERRLAACYHALEKAVAEMRRFDSPHYGLGFKRGTLRLAAPQPRLGGREAGGLRGAPAAVSRAVPQGG